jgi:hypothetical protein
MVKVKEIYKILENDANLANNINSSNSPVPQESGNKSKRKSVTIMVGNVQPNTIAINKIYHLICIVLQKIIVNLLKCNDFYYNEIFVKAKFGLLLGDLLRTQYKYLSNIFDKKKNDINTYNNYVQENKLRAQFIEGILNTSKEELKLQFIDVNNC